MKKNVVKKSMPGKFLKILLPILLVAGVGTAIYRWQTTRTGKPTFKDEVEPTLTAKNPVLELLDTEDTGIDFQNIIVETEENNITRNINKYNGGGLAIADINNDGLQDIYFVCSNGKNKMYLNQGNFKFKDITDASGLASEEGFETGVTAVDINQDGYLDFYVCRAGPDANDDRRNKLFINNKNLTFSEQSKNYGLDDMSSSNSANFFDYDLDGDLDLYLLNHPLDLVYASKIDVKPGPDGNPIPNITPKKPYDSDRFYRNDGNHFTDVSESAGIWNFAFGLSVSVSDFNFDGYPDVYVANDFMHADFLYINNKNGTFSNELPKFFKHCSQHTMGTDLNDFDNDGLIDLIGVDMYPANNYRLKTVQTTNTLSKYLSMVKNGYFEPVVRNVLQRNNGNGTFSDVACLAQVFRTDWSWSALMADFNNDGLKDLHFTNGYRREVTNRDFFDFFTDDIGRMTSQEYMKKYGGVDGILKRVPTQKLRNFVFQNQGDWNFTDKNGDWMTMKGSWSCGAAWGDLDNDGDLDLVVNNLEDPAFVYKNKQSDNKNNNFLQVKLIGAPKNAFAVGASAKLTNGTSIQYSEINPTRGIFSSVQHLLHFGVGKLQTIENLEVRWPDGKTQRFQNIAANQVITANYQDASGNTACLVQPYQGPTLLHDVTRTVKMDFRHIENAYNDLEQFPLNPWMVTEQGPLIAKGDVNKDGLDDFFVGNAFASMPALYVQQPNATFKRTADNIWSVERIYEDQGAVFFDFDRDGDLDLYVVSGGPEAVAKTRELAWTHRLYLNMDGKGTFAKVNPALLPPIKVAAMRVAAYDYDNDGDEDLFVGGRVTADKWPLTPNSMVIRNDNNKLTDVTAEVAGDFEKCGMVTDLSWNDLDGDGFAELIVVGEWMPVSVFKISGGKLINATNRFGLEKSNGLWFKLATADVDGDGDVDLVTGNLGLNSRYAASTEYPLGCYGKDFDKNGIIDPIITYFEKGKEYPIVQKDALTKHMPGLKKKLLYASQYGHAEIADVWPTSELKTSLQLKAYTLETCWWENKNGKFILRKLPRYAQSAPVQGIVVADFNADNIPDILMAGNKKGFEVETGPIDAGNGTLLIGKGSGNFEWLNNTLTGFWAQGEVRDITRLQGKNNTYTIVVGNNNQPLQLFRN